MLGSIIGTLSATDPSIGYRCTTKLGVKCHQLLENHIFIVKNYVGRHLVLAELALGDVKFALGDGLVEEALALLIGSPPSSIVVSPFGVEEEDELLEVEM
ncbi:hypothetical protein LR48_Vigan03g049200 [Vigna angularis]|uniref:Uncharacterized protein n=1 Tax=Phaseolus angularis TaxID=3914 RepID=A0A0L9U2W5_PHAAN|nr:hypothetical protein LR48_Vigan03g049200 [Vigna angularis]